MAGLEGDSDYSDEGTVVAKSARRNPLARYGALSVLATTAIQVLNVATGVILARTLGPGGRGELTAALLWPTLLGAVTELGNLEAASYLIARGTREHAVIATTGLTVALFESFVVVGAGLLIIPVVLGHYGAKVVGASELYLLWLPLSFMMVSALGIFQGHFDVAVASAMRVLIIALIALGLGGLYLGHQISIMGVVLVYLAAHALTLAIIFVILASRGYLGARPRGQFVIPIVSYGAKAHLSNLWGWANERADMTIMSVFLPAASLGLYSIAVTIASPLVLLGNSVAMFTLPTVASSHDAAEKQRDFARLVRMNLFLTLAAGVVLFLATPYVIAIFFGGPFLPASLAARILIVAAVVLSMNRVLGAGLKAYNKALVPGAAEILGVTVDLGGLWALLPSFRIVGAAWASLLAYSVSLGVMLSYAKTRLGIGPHHFIVPSQSDLVALRTWLSHYRLARLRK